MLLLFGNFLVISLYLGDGVGSAPVLSPRPTGPPPPSCSICVQRAKCPPLPAKKREPPASENGGRWRKREREHPLSKARIQIKKKYNNNNNIIIIIHKCNRQQDTEHNKGSGGRAGGAQAGRAGGEIVNSSSGRLRGGSGSHHFNVQVSSRILFTAEPSASGSGAGRSRPSVGPKSPRPSSRSPVS